MMAIDAMINPQKREGALRGVARETPGIEPALRVAFSPVWPGNPSHSSLIETLTRQGVHISEEREVKGIYGASQNGRERLDVLHLHALPYFRVSPKNLARYLVFYDRLRRLKASGVKIVWTVHDLDNHDSGFTRLESAVSRFVARRVDALIAHGDTARELIVDRWGVAKEKVAVIPHGNFIGSYPNEIGTSAARRRIGYEPAHRVFLFLGLIRPYKGVPEMIREFRQQSDANARLLIAGRPVTLPLQEEIASLVQGDDRIIFRPGFVRDEDVQVYMNAADVVVLPYRRILTSGAAILAMGFGKPCIAPRSGCVTDALDAEGAVFFDPNAPDGLRRAFMKMDEKWELRERMGEHNLERARRWDWETVARATRALYEGCVEQ